MTPFWLIPAFLIVSSVWDFVSSDYYHCTDSLPILDFFPPFVHDAGTGDYYKNGMTEESVMQIWYYYLAAIPVTALLLSFIGFKFFKNLYKEIEKSLGL